VAQSAAAKEKLKKSMREIILLEPESQDDPEEHLERLLADPSFYKAFVDFLSMELKCKFILFWRDVGSYKERRLSGSDLKNLYLLPESPFPIQINENIKSEILSSLEEINQARKQNLRETGTEKDLGIFDKAKEEVFQNNLLSAYSRFRATDSFKKWKRRESLPSNDSDLKKIKFGWCSCDLKELYSQILQIPPSLQDHKTINIT
jgi:hypothetical protein